MKTIWKYEIPLKKMFSLYMPRRPQIKHIAMQGDTPCLWAIVDTDAPNAPRTFHVVGTGHQMPEVEPLEYCGTFHGFGGFGEPLVFHVFVEAGE